MLIVGLTGGIASGKSTISAHLKSLGVPVYDTDETSRQLMQPGQDAYAKSVKHFGAEILNNDKTINRAKLRQIVFDQPHQKQWLERMIHPLVRARSKQLLREATDHDYAVLVVPLMFETGFEELVDFIVAIDCTRTVQLARLIQRDGISESLAISMIESQMDNEQRLELADHAIENQGDRGLFAEVEQLHAKLTALAHRQNRK